MPIALPSWKSRTKQVQLCPEGSDVSKRPARRPCVLLHVPLFLFSHPITCTRALHSSSPSVILMCACISGHITRTLRHCHSTAEPQHVLVQVASGAPAKMPSETVSTGPGPDEHEVERLTARLVNRTFDPHVSVADVRFSIIFSVASLQSVYVHVLESAHSRAHAPLE